MLIVPVFVYLSVWAFVCLDLKWLVLYCEATIQRSIIPYLPTFSIFLPFAPYKDSALPNQGPLWGWARRVCNWHLVQGCEMKKAPHTMRQRPHTRTDFRHVVFVWKEELVFVCQELFISSHTPSEPCEVCWSLPSNYSLKFRKLSLNLLAYLLNFHCFDRITGCNYLLITCVWNLLSFHYH